MFFWKQKGFGPTLFTIRFIVKIYRPYTIQCYLKVCLIYIRVFITRWKHSIRFNYERKSGGETARWFLSNNCASLIEKSYTRPNRRKISGYLYQWSQIRRNRSTDHPDCERKPRAISSTGKYEHRQQSGRSTTQFATTTHPIRKIPPALEADTRIYNVYNQLKWALTREDEEMWKKCKRGKCRESNKSSKQTTLVRFPSVHLIWFRAPSAQLPVESQ